MVEIVGEAKALFDELISEGLGVAGGFIGGAFVGRQAQTLLGWTDAAIANTATTLDYMGIAKAWIANNGPKIGLWYLLKRYDAGSELTKDADKALLGSVVFDTLMRLLNSGLNPATATIHGYEVLGSGTATGATTQAQIQDMAQQINILKGELKKAMQIQAAQGPYGAPPQYNPVQASAPIVTPYVEGAPLPAPASRRARETGFMAGEYVSGAPYPVPAAVAVQPNPAIATDRQARFGFMAEQKVGISRAAAMCGMQ